jgi:FKBP-type peptidyl-prolyl cis-trans isomerase
MGESVNFKAKVTPAQTGASLADGSVKFFDGSTLLGKATINANNKANLKGVYYLYKGSHSITAKYVASASFATSTSAAATLSIAKGPTSKGSDGLQVDTISAGTGPTVAQDDAVTVNYTGYLTDGTKFDSSLNAGRSPLGFAVEQSPEAVVTGFDEGVVGMAVGGVRTLILPASIAYANSPPQGSIIPDGAKLTFIIQMVTVAQPELTVTGSNSTPITSAESPNTTDGTDFGQVVVGASSSTTTITLGAGNSAALAFTETPEIALAGADPSDFSITQPAIANGSATFTIIFNPTADGLRTANINIFTNDPTNPTFHIKVTGSGF